VATIVAASLIVSVAGCCIWSVKDREGVPANIAGNFSCEVVISVHGQDENTPPNSRIVTILCWINFGTIERTQFRPSRNRFRFHGGGRGAALTSPGPETLPRSSLGCCLTFPSVPGIFTSNTALRVRSSKWR